VYRHAQERALLTPYQRKARGLKDTYEADIKPLNKYRYFLLYIMVPSTELASEHSFQVKAAYEATTTIVALRRYRLAEGSYPETLADLVAAGYLAREPLDPYSDGPLVYRRQGDGFTLYSVAADFRDDGGVPADWGGPDAPGDYVFWPVAAPADESAPEADSNPVPAGGAAPQTQPAPVASNAAD
jgi:hypothetical protein